MSTISGREKKSYLWQFKRHELSASDAFMRRAVGLIFFRSLFFPVFVVVVVWVFIICIHRFYTRKMIRCSIFAWCSVHTYGSFFRRWGINSRERRRSRKKRTSGKSVYLMQKSRSRNGGTRPIFNSLFIIYYFILSIFKWVAHFASEAAVRGWFWMYSGLMCISSGCRRRHAYKPSAAVSDEHIKKYVRHNFIRI